MLKTNSQIGYPIYKLERFTDGIEHVHTYVSLAWSIMRVLES